MNEMNVHDATETAYNNGFEAGYLKGLYDMCEAVKIISAPEDWKISVEVFGKMSINNIFSILPPEEILRRAKMYEEIKKENPELYGVDDFAEEMRKIIEANRNIKAHGGQR